ADHGIADEPGFRSALTAAARAAQDGSLVTLGIGARGPETGYGYIVGTSDGPANGSRRVERFVEKPDRETAAQLLESPNGAWWNAGIFIWRRDAVLASLDRHAPGIVGVIRRGMENGQSLAAIYEALPDISIDRALM